MVVFLRLVLLPLRRAVGKVVVLLRRAVGEAVLVRRAVVLLLSRTCLVTILPSTVGVGVVLLLGRAVGNNWL